MGASLGLARSSANGRAARTGRSARPTRPADRRARRRPTPGRRRPARSRWPGPSRRPPAACPGCGGCRPGTAPRRTAAPAPRRHRPGARADQQRQQVLGEQPQVVRAKRSPARNRSRARTTGPGRRAEAGGHGSILARRPQLRGVSHRCNSSDSCYSWEFWGYSDGCSRRTGVDMLVPPAHSVARTARPEPVVGPLAVRGVLVTVVATAAATLSAAPAQARNVVTPGQLHRLRLRPVRRARPRRRWTRGCAARRSWASASTSPAPPAAAGTSRTSARGGSAPSCANGWRLLPITLGPQAWCTTRERYLHQVRINPSSRASYSKARAQGRAEARKTVRAAHRLGISRGSHALVRPRGVPDLAPRLPRVGAELPAARGPASCTASHYVSGVYSSAASGIKILDDARVAAPRSRTRCPTGSGSPTGTAARTPRSSYVRQRGLAAAPARAPVPRRPPRDATAA